MNTTDRRVIADLTACRNPLPLGRACVKIGGRVHDATCQDIGTFLGWDVDGDPVIKWDGYLDPESLTYLGDLRPYPTEGN